MKGLKYLFIIFSAAICIVSVISCSSDTTGIATVKINTGLGSSRSAVTKAPAPSNIMSITISITGTDIEPINAEFDLSGGPDTVLYPIINANPDLTPMRGAQALTYDSVNGIITAEVPAGSNRSFTVTADVDPDDPGVILSWAGSAVSEITEGKNFVSITMGMSETKIVIPDQNNGRVVQIDAFAADGLGWIALLGTDFSPQISPFYPYDIDIDNRGRIYIAHNGYATDGGKIYRIDNMTDRTAETIQIKNDGINSLAIDRINNYVYYSHLGMSSLNRYNYDSLVDTPLVIDSGVAAINTIRGLAVDENGILYIAGATNGAQTYQRIFKYDPETETVTDYYDLGTLATPWDVLVKGENIFVANVDFTGDYGILQLDTDLNLTGHFGNVFIYNSQDHPAPSPGELAGPRRFLATLNRKITIIDEDSSGFVDRLVEFDLVTGAERVFVPDTAQGAFHFYNC